MQEVYPHTEDDSVMRSTHTLEMAVCTRRLTIAATVETCQELFITIATLLLQSFAVNLFLNSDQSSR